MTKGLVRYQETGNFHFLTFSCYQRRPYFGTPEARSLFERSLGSMRVRYGFFVAGYVVMPEHVHLLLSEPRQASLATALQALKLSVAVQRPERPFWQPRYYDFNVHSEAKRTEKLRYIHRNPIARGLVSRPHDWPWSSFQHWLSGALGPVEVESQWTARRRGGLPTQFLHSPDPPQTQVSDAGPGAPNPLHTNDFSRQPTQPSTPRAPTTSARAGAPHLASEMWASEESCPIIAAGS